MKVMCINDSWIADHDMNQVPGRPSFGDEDIVIGTFQKYCKFFYCLERFGKDRGFLQSHFMPVSNTETLVEEFVEPAMQL